MVLTKQRIYELLYENKDFKVSPILEPNSQIEEGSINLRLGTKYIRFNRETILSWDLATLDPKEISKKTDLNFCLLGEKLYLQPGELMLATTFEYIALPLNLCAYVLSRSSYGRIGLLVATATFVHPGWKGCLTLELVNTGCSPIELRTGACIAQLVIHQVDVPLKQYVQRHFPIEPQITTKIGERDWDMLKHIQEYLKKQLLNFES